MRERDPLSGLRLVLRSVDAVRNRHALFALLATFASAGLLVSMAEASLARDAAAAASLQAGVALFLAFYGGNTVGILVMDQARGRAVRGLPAAFRTALLTSHRLLLALAVVLGAVAVGAGVLLALLWLSRVSVSGPVVGPVLFGLVVPFGVLAVGLGALTLLAVVVPLTAPAVWSGGGAMQAAQILSEIVKRRLLTALLLMAVVSVLTAGAGAIATFVVVTGGRVIAELGVRVVGVDVPAPQLMAGLFGRGLRTLGEAGVPTATNAHAAAALVGGGVVFALALLLPGLVYLRGSCAAYLALAGDEPSPG
jgi:hypothetical protein